MPMLFTLAAAAQSVTGWVEVGRDQRSTVSGIARVGADAGPIRFLIVHDNKHNGEPRLAVITIGPPVRYAPVGWPAGYALPVDLEAAAAVPDVPGMFAVMTSGGTVSLLSLSKERAQLHAAFTLPNRPGFPEFEAFDVQMIGGVRTAVWGQRGAGTARGRLYWGRLELDPPRILHVADAEIVVPFPSPDDPDTRHLSDIKIDAATGDVWSTAAHDPGDAGPFESAVYRLGRMGLDRGEVRFEAQRPLVPLYRVNRKLEALELFGERLALATDDEYAGAAIAVLPR